MKRKKEDYEQDKRQIYLYTLKHPTKTYLEIAKDLKFSKSKVSRALSEITQSVDYQLAMKTAGKFLDDFQKATDAYKLYIEELEELKKDPKVKLHAIDSQGRMWDRILNIARQGEFIEALRLVNNGKLKLSTSS